jgi:D-alanyl-lipoteichoic acid acyltransferase DltB (MBOAT superfamily)
MIFNSIEFLIFFVLFVPIYFLLKGQSRIIFTLISSYLFYGWWDPRFLVLIIFSTCFDWFAGLYIHSHSDLAKRKTVLTLSIVVNLSVLGFFKYFNFFIDSASELLRFAGLESGSAVLNIILPVGISFYTFQSMSYTIDIYRKEIEPEKSLIRFATFVAFFPQLVAGPIVRAVDFLPQIQRNNQRWNWTNFTNGFGLILTGFAKKIIIADSLAPFVDSAFHNPELCSSLTLILATIFYSFQIYCDFSGYSDIAIGTAKILGYDFPLNFNLPYFSKSFSEFWTRWHISLSQWLRDYLYIPLGGNRKGKLITYRNLMITMLLGGLWHGANYTFIIWGFLHGFYLVLQRGLVAFMNRLKINWEGPLCSAISLVIVYSLTCFAWIFFRSQTLSDANHFISGILAFDSMSLSALPNKFEIFKNLIVILLLISLEGISLKIDFNNLFLKKPVFRLCTAAIIIWLIALIGTFSSAQFIYFQF